MKFKLKTGPCAAAAAWLAAAANLCQSRLLAKMTQAAKAHRLINVFYKSTFSFLNSISAALCG
jgi:hypothetical protein